MSDSSRTTRAAMAALVQSFGCFDAVAETISARWGGGCSKGTISKKIAGLLDWTLPDVIALEDAAGRFPVSRLLARRMSGDVVSSVGSLLSDGASIARETGEAVAAILSAQASASAADEAQAIVEIDEAIEALRIARARLVARSEICEGGGE